MGGKAVIIFDDSIASVFGDYGIMLPIEPSRARKITASLDPDVYPPPDGRGIFPGPVLDIGAAAALAGTTGEPVTRADVERVHSAGYVNALYSSGLSDALLAAYELVDADGNPNRYEPDRAVKPLTALFDKILAQCAGSYLACKLALCGAQHFCYFLGGGNHHARYDSGAGFCLINEIIIAARKLQAEGDARFVWIIDVDAHKGCGSAELVAFIRSGRNPARFETGCGILTLSAHMAHGWPLDD
ncbi:MAG: hypothetical protein LBJ86_06995, partial [Spirochaetaceae bacterium]|nr:hypothetical protein [Spirochaetaceae bacterium]